MPGPYPLGLTADVLLFRPDAGTLKVLLIRRGHDPFAGHWAFPGGFVDEPEPVLVAAERELMEETHAEVPWLEEVGTFATPGRDPRSRVVTVAYLCLMDEAPRVEAGDDAAEAAWFEARNPPPLAFDHDQVLAQGLQVLAQGFRTAEGLRHRLPGSYSWAELQARVSLLMGADVDKAALHDSLGPLMKPTADGRLALDDGALKALEARLPLP